MVVVMMVNRPKVTNLSSNALTSPQAACAVRTGARHAALPCFGPGLPMNAQVLVIKRVVGGGDEDQMTTTWTPSTDDDSRSKPGRTSRFKAEQEGGSTKHTKLSDSTGLWTYSNREGRRRPAMPKAPPVASFNIGPSLLRPCLVGKPAHEVLGHVVKIES